MNLETEKTNRRLLNKPASDSKAFNRRCSQCKLPIVVQVIESKGLCRFWLCFFIGPVTMNTLKPRLEQGTCNYCLHPPFWPWSMSRTNYMPRWEKGQCFTLNRVKYLTFRIHFLRGFNVATCFQRNPWLPLAWLVISYVRWFPILFLSCFNFLSIHSFSNHTRWIQAGPCYHGLLCHRLPSCNLCCFFVGEWTLKFLS